ncbi:glutamate--tRNA ligase, cytoplasmic-like [Beta vulgaris subsp. vulgaris]|uniref:glutamate--tRNA ligase, cytoplasmic-like n=1 Tax=Beta vulgaris subsp. vulgaris TaxID=3555 RepID=UPI00053F5B72|nr:glutamate--tRNA ligase, cytoplasmic-like [Beta vulgaris subsp. vulgaris]
MEMKLLYAVDNPPLPVIAACSIRRISMMDSLPSSSAPSFILPDGSKIEGTFIILRYIGRRMNLYGKGVFQSGQVDEWLDYIPIFYQASKFEVACSFVDTFLSTSSFLVGCDLSIADLALWSALSETSQRWGSLMRSKKYKNLVRWYNSLMHEYATSLNQVLRMVVGNRKPSTGISTDSNSKSLSGIYSNGVTSEKTNTPSSSLPEIDLPNAEVGKVCLRFAPEPNGYLHIGHSKAALLNKYFADKYEGRLIVRLDDTNPAKESDEFVQSLLKDIDSLGLVYEVITYTSDYFPRLMEMAEKLIREGKAYVDDTPVEQMRTERDEGVESKCRGNTLSKNLELWKEMIAGSERGIKCCLRGKIDFQNPNKCLRDPVYYRCNLVPHHRVGSKYKVYPTYNFASPFVDALEGVTHALRSNEYRDRDAQYHLIQKDMGVREVCFYEFSRLNMVYTLLSKRKLLWFVQNGRVEGWDDPRLPTVQGMVRRGLKIEALAQFIREQRASTNQNMMEWDKLWSINKRIIDPVCPRHTAVLEDRRVIISLIDGPVEPFVRILPRHKKLKDTGDKCIYYTKNVWIDYVDALSISLNDEVTLMDWGNAIIKEMKRDETGTIVQLIGVLHLEGSVKATKLRLTWLPEMDELVRLQLVEFDYLITKEKLEKMQDEEDFLKTLNPVTRKDTLALGDSNMRNLKSGDIIQLERKGYFRCDVPYLRHSKPMVLFAIPDGRQRNVVK